MGHTQATLSSRQVHRLDSNSHFCSNNKEQSTCKVQSLGLDRNLVKKKYFLDSHNTLRITIPQHTKKPRMNWVISGSNILKTIKSHPKITQVLIKRQSDNDINTCTILLKSTDLTNSYNNTNCPIYSIFFDSTFD